MLCGRSQKKNEEWLVSAPCLIWAQSISALIPNLPTLLLVNEAPKPSGPSPWRNLVTTCVTPAGPWVSLPQPAQRSSSSEYTHSFFQRGQGYLHTAVWDPSPILVSTSHISFRLAKSPCFRNMTAFPALLKG